MASFSSVLRRCLFMLSGSLAFVCTLALAQTPVMWGGVATSAHPLSAYDTAMGACQSYNGGTAIDHIEWKDDGHYWCWRPGTNGVPTHFADTFSVSGWCDSPGTMDHTSGVCTCPDGTQQSTDMCANHTQTTCPYGQYMLQGSCAPIPCDAGTHYGADPDQGGVTVNKCISDCPSNTVTDINATTHIQLCHPQADPDDDKTKTSENPTCPATYEQIGFDGDGKAVCRAGPKTDPCPAGTHNISADPADANCAGNTPSPPSTVTQATEPPVTTTGADGSTTKTGTTTTTYPDGSKLTSTTTTTTGTDGKTTTKTTQSCDRDGACGGALSGGGGGGGSGGSGSGNDQKVDHVSDVSGDLYVKGEKTFSQVLGDFTTTINNAPFMQASKSFFSATIPGGACPAWTISIDYLHTAVSLGDYFCGGGALDGLAVMSIGVLIAAAWVAFRIAFL